MLYSNLMPKLKSNFVVSPVKNFVRLYEEDEMHLVWESILLVRTVLSLASFANSNLCLIVMLSDKSF